MKAMRLMIPMDNPVKNCRSCHVDDEVKISAQILAFQLAEQFLRRYSGTWRVTDGDLEVRLKGVEQPLRFERKEGVLAYGTVRTPILARYTADKGLTRLTEELVHDLGLPPTEEKDFQDPLFCVFVKLMEIFHARCGLKIRAFEENFVTVGWEVYLCEDGPYGWISQEGIAENQFGEQVDIKTWNHLRQEKLASYVFGFFAFCQNYTNPLTMH